MASKVHPKYELSNSEYELHLSIEVLYLMRS